VWHLGEDGNVLEAVPGESVPVEYRTAGPNCDHCGTRRRRKDTFLVKHIETGEVRQVGSTCLHDFLGIDPHMLVSRYTWIKQLVSVFAEYSGDGCGSGWEPSTGLGHFVNTTAAFVSVFGYRSSTKCREEGYGSPTGGDVFNLITGDHKRYRSFFEGRDKQRERYEDALDEDDTCALASATLCWLGTLDKRPDAELNDYLHNLRTAASMGFVVDRSANLLASAVVAFRREHEIAIERAARKQRKPSEYVGEVGKRFDIEVEIAHEDAWEGHYGMTYFYKFYGPKDQVFVWFGSSTLGRWAKNKDNPNLNPVWERPEIGDKVWIRGTAKRHELHTGKGKWAADGPVKQTILNRVVLLNGPPKLKKARKKTKKAKATAQAAAVEA